MTELMLRPGWPNQFRRTVGEGKRQRSLQFLPNVPVEVTAAEMKLLKTDIGISIFEVVRDEKGRPRFVESEPIPVPDLAGKEEMELDVAENV